MTIQIDIQALRGENDRLLKTGALYGLKRLAEADYRLQFDPEKLSSKQQELLENEQIFSAGEKEAADARVVPSPDGKLQFEAEGQMIASAGDWIAMSEKILFPARTATRRRKTAETDITISLNLDGAGNASIDTGLKFFDHMLEQIARHGLIDLEITASGDLEVDEHHTVEDVAITLGETVDRALGDKTGIQRYGFVLPMDESLSTIALDLSGRPWLEFEGTFKREMVGDFPTEMVEHFFHSLAIHLKATIHLKVEGRNDHHKIEACFKGLARCLRAAVSRSERNRNILPSTKDLL